MPSFRKGFVIKKKKMLPWNGARPKGLLRRPEVENNVKKALSASQEGISIIQT